MEKRNIYKKNESHSQKVNCGSKNEKMLSLTQNR